MGSVEMRALRCVLWRDLLLALRRRGDVATALLFFVIVASLFPLGVGAQPNLLREIAPGVIWVAALLSSLLSLRRLFESDHADGTLEQILLGAAPLGVVVLAKAAAHWLASGLPLVAIGGITHANAAEVIAAGADGVAVISAVLRDADPGESFRRLSAALRPAR